MLNSLTLDRGPASSIPAELCRYTNDNCWASGNAGEMDFLEPAWNAANASQTQGYRTSYSTQVNQVGRCFPGGVNGGGFKSKNYLLTAPMDSDEAVVYVAVVDRVGNWVYRIPAAEVEAIWPGLGEKQAAKEIVARPTRTPDTLNPATTPYGAVFTSNCQASTVEEARAQGCSFNAQQGFCSNWMAEMADTKQPLFPSESCERDTRGGVTMPWCKQMVG